MRSFIAMFGVVFVCAGVGRADVGGVDKVPVVLVPGFMGQHQSGVMQRYWASSIVDALHAEGVDVTELHPPPLATSEVRGRALLRQIDAVRARTGAAKVIVLAHSQGGVDVRAALAQGGADRIAAVATIASPHHGTGIAETALAWPRPLVRATLDVIAVSWELGEGENPTRPDAEGALDNLTRAGMTRFAGTEGRATTEARATTGAAEVTTPFFTIASYTGRDVDGSCRGGAWETPQVIDSMHPLLVFGHAMVRSAWGEVTQDGVVPTGSMRYGTFLGCVAADHLDWEGFDDRGPTDVAAFTRELYRGLNDVALTEDAAAMDPHIARLALLAHARPVLLRPTPR